MSYVYVLSVGFALAICVLPPLLLRRPAGPDRFPWETDRPAPTAIIRNAWIAYAVRASVFLSLFSLAATGEIWPALAAAAGWGAGICLLAAASRRVDGPAEEGSRRETPASFHAWLAQSCADAASVRLAAASATSVALLGLAGAEAAALTAVLTPLVGDGFGVPCFLVLVLAAGLYAVRAGENVTRYASQALLGAISVGLFGSAALVLYLYTADLRPLPPHGAFALLALTACCIAILLRRQTKYVETPRLVAADEPVRWRRTLAEQVRLLQRFANLSISVLLVLIVVLAGLQFYFLGLPNILRDGLTALGTAPHMPAFGIASIAMLAAVYPLVDAASWRSVAALAQSEPSAAAGTGASDRSARRSTRIVAAEAALIGLAIAAYGTIAVLAADLPPSEIGIADFVRQLVAFEHGVTDGALTLLLVGLFAMAAAAMGTAIATALAVIRIDIVAGVRAGAGDPAHPAAADRAAVALLAAMGASVAALWIGSGIPSAGAADTRLLAMALGFACLQVSLLPLLLARLRRIALPGAGAALATIGVGVAAGLGCIVAYGVTGDPLWPWLAVPACLLSGLSCLAVAVMRARAIASRS